MKLRNLLHIQENNIHLIASLSPLFLYKLSDITSEFIKECSSVGYEEAIVIIRSKYSLQEFKEFKIRISRIKKKLFILDERNIRGIDFSQKVSTLTLNLTRKCNLKCSYCFEDENYRKKKDMTFEIAKKAIDIFFTDKSTTWIIIFTGGEPLINYNLIQEIVSYIADRGLKVDYRIKTNATLLNEKRINYLIKNKFKIQISLDGDEKAHDTHRNFASGKGSFQMVDKILRTLIKKKYSSSIAISATTTHHTINFINDSYAHLNSYKGVRYHIKPVMCSSEGNHILNEYDYMTVYDAFIKNKGKELKLDSNQSINEKKNICGIGIWNISIDVDGKIYPCYRLCGEKKYIMGDICSFAFPLKLAKDIKKIYKLENTIKCSKCYFISKCKSGCYAEKLMTKEIDNCMNKEKLHLEKIIYSEIIIKGAHKIIELI